MNTHTEPAKLNENSGDMFGIVFIGCGVFYILLAFFLAWMLD